MHTQVYTDADFASNEVNELLWIKRHAATTHKTIKCLKQTSLADLVISPTVNGENVLIFSFVCSLSRARPCRPS